MIEFYKIDSDGDPVKVPWDEFWFWHSAIPEDYRTGVGYKVVVDVKYDITVSTVFLSTDHSFGKCDQPILWETMIFDGAGEALVCNRYTSQADAINGHKRIYFEQFGCESECEAYCPV